MTVELVGRYHATVPSAMLYLVRHCHATGQHSDARLSPDGEEQAARLADLLAPRDIRRIRSSPFLRARASIQPLAARLGIPVEIDARLAERVLTTAPLDEWKTPLRASFADLDACLEGGESSRVALARGLAALDDALSGERPVAVVTHGNLLALLLSHLGGGDGYATWEQLTNPDVFAIDTSSPDTRPARMRPVS